MLQIFHKKTGQRGFTLIELLVVIAIIGILATIVLVSLNSARSKSRNARRVSDLRQIQLGEEIYYDGVGAGSYSGTLGALVTGNAISAVPVDPSTNGAYAYCAASANYWVGTQLEATQVAGQGLMATSISATKAGGITCTLNAGVPAVTAAQCGTVATGLGYYCVAP